MTAGRLISPYHDVMTVQPETKAAWNVYLVGGLVWGGNGRMERGKTEMLL